MNKVTALLILIFLVFQVSAVVIQIGDGTLLNQCLPVEPLMHYSYSQSIFTADEIMTMGIIDAVGFQYRVTSNIFLPYTNQFSIYLDSVDRDRFHSATDWVPLDSLTLVWQGELMADMFYPGLPGEGWLSIPLTTPYVYLAEDNLVIAVDENMPGNSNMADDFYCTAVSLPQSIEYHSMSVNPDPATPPAAYTGNPLSVRPNLQLNFVVHNHTPNLPLPVNNAVDVDLTPNLSWQSDAEYFDVWFAPANQTLQLVAENLDSLNWTLPNALALYSQYNWQVVAHYLMMDYEGPVWSFRTVGETLSAPQNLTAMTVGMDVRLEWQTPAQGSIVSYRVYRNQQLIEECQPTEFLDTTVLPGQTYWYYVEAVNYLNQVSPPSNTVSVTMPGALPVWQMNCENELDFATALNGWIMYDLDGSLTWQFSNFDFPGEGSPLCWMVFNPSQTNPPVTTVLPHSGEKMLLCIDSMNPPNNDWLISPRLSILSGYELSFWTRSWTDDYGLERLRFLISTTDTLTTSFVPLSAEPWLAVPAAWTQVIYDLQAYAGQQVYLAWQGVSWDAFALCLDDIVITQNVSNQDEFIPSVPDFRIYPNPAGEWFRVMNESKAPFDISIYNTKGQKIVSRKGVTEYAWKKGESLKLKPGLYIIRIHSELHSDVLKLVIF